MLFLKIVFEITFIHKFSRFFKKFVEIDMQGYNFSCCISKSMGNLDLFSLFHYCPASKRIYILNLGDNFGHSCPNYNIQEQ